MDMKIYQKEELRGTQYIELTHFPADQKANAWNNESLYMTDTVFSLVFSYPFHGASNKYDLFGFAEFKKQEQEKLLLQLIKNGEAIDKLESYTEVIEFSNRSGNEYNFIDLIPKDKTSISNILTSMRDLNSAVINYVKDSITKNHTLAVLGL